MGFPRSFFRTSLRLVWWTLAAVIIAVAVLLVSLRLALPLAGRYHDEVAQLAGRLLDHPVSLTGLGASWHGFGPSIELQGVTIFDDKRRPLLQCAAARIDIGLLASLRRGQIELDQLTVRGAHVTVLRREDGSLALLGLNELDATPPDPAAAEMLKQWVARQPRLVVEDSVLEWRDLAPGGRAFRFHGARMEIRNRDGRHRVDADLALPESLGRRLAITAELSGDLFTPAGWSGDIYLRGERLALGAVGAQAWSGIDLRAGSADVEVWSDWRAGPQRVAGTVHASDVRVVLRRGREGAQRTDLQNTAAHGAQKESAEVSPATLAELYAQFQWRRAQEGWELDANRVVFRTPNAEEGAPAEWRVVYRAAADGARGVEVGFSRLRIEDAAALAKDAAVLPDMAEARLAALAPHGELRNGYLRYRWDDATAPTWLLRTEFRQLAWSAAEAVPGVANVSGALASDGGRGAITLEAGPGAIDAARWFRAPLPLDHASGRLAWRREGDSWQLGGDDLVVENEDLRGRAAFRFVRVAGMETPRLDFYADFADGNGAHATRYLPATLMHEKAVSWVDRAIVGGRVTRGEARLSGWLNEFPFDRGDGVFDVSFHVTDGVLDYAPGWPPLREIVTDVRFVGRSLDLHANAARAFDSEVTRAEVKVADLAGHPAVVTVNGTARGPTADALRFVAQSPLNKKFGDYLAGMAASGTSRLDLALGLPLAEQPARVRGALYFINSGLNLREVGIDIAAIDGRLGFYEGGLRGRDIRARLFDQPAVIAVRGEGEGRAHVTLFEAEGTADAAAIARRFLPQLASRLEGSAPWRGSLKVMPPQQGGTRLQISSPLKGVAIRLPEPLAKSGRVERPFALDLPLPLKGDRATRVRYGNEFDARLLLASVADAITLRRGEVRLGGGNAVLPDDDRLSVRGRMPRLAVADWLALREGHTAVARAGAMDISALDIALDTDVLRVVGQSFDGAALRARRSGEAWQVEVEGATIAGELRIPDEDDAPLTAEFARLYFSAPSGGAEGGPQPDPRSLPALQIHVADFRYAKLDLGELTLRTLRGARGMRVERVKALSSLHTLDLRGSWEAENGRQQSAFSLSFDSRDVGETLRSLGYADVVKDGKMHTDMNLTWVGSPADFALARAAGSVTISLGEGRLLDVNPGAGRMLGLLSLQALPRRLSLDFSDLFQKGLAFDRIEGNFAVGNGVARTDNLTMDGPAARIVARGKVGLATEDYDQRVAVIPKVSAGLPLAGALAGGVAGGAAALLVERLLKRQIDQIGRVEYQVTGPWTAPVVERIAGVGKETENKGKVQGAREDGE